MEIDKDLERAILFEIAKRYPFSIADVSDIYNKVKSFDIVIRACEASVVFGLGMIDRTLGNSMICNCHCKEPGMWHDMGCPMRKLPELKMWRDIR